MQQNENMEQLIARYLNGNCNREEQQKLVKWVNQSNENKTLFFSLKDTWDASLKKENIHKKALFDFYKKQATQKLKPLKTTRFLQWATSIAAILIIGLSFVIIKNQPFAKNNTMVVYSVPLGSRSDLILPDGTLINLNSGSKLEYPADFNIKNRFVKLSGEAFFNVVSDKINPFIINTTDFDIEVTGTKFNVSVYNDNTYSSIALLEGKVALSSSNLKPLDLKPGEKIRFEKIRKQYQYVNFDEKSEIAWKNKQFIFNNIAFPELIKRLERWYDVKLNYSSKELDSLFYTGSFKNKETIWQVLDALKLTSPIDYKRIDFRKFQLNYLPM